MTGLAVVMWLPPRPRIVAERALPHARREPATGASEIRRTSPLPCVAARCFPVRADGPGNARTAAMRTLVLALVLVAAAAGTAAADGMRCSDPDDEPGC